MKKAIAYFVFIELIMLSIILITDSCINWEGFLYANIFMVSISIVTVIGILLIEKIK